jgi:hypothetical protein
MVDKCERCKHWGVRKIGNFTFDYGFCSFLEGEGRGQIAIMDVDGYISGGDGVVTKPGFCCNNFEA